MIQVETELGPVYIPQSVGELPTFPADIDTVYTDVETTSFDPKVEAFLPYNGHRVAGIAITWDDLHGAYYVPIRHTDKHWNLPVKAVMRWLRGSKRARRWRNHNVKFDAHMLRQDDFEWEGEMVCSLSEAKMLDTDRFGHGLKPLCKDPDWCSLPMEEEDDVKAYLKGIKSKNYGDVPADMMGKYAGMDVMGNRTLCRFIDLRFPESMQMLREQEQKLTPVLYDIEVEGLRADRIKLMIEGEMTARRIINIAGSIAAITGFEFTDSNKTLMQILCGQYDLPVLSYKWKKNEESGEMVRGNPSFDRDALELYSTHPQVLEDEELTELIRLIISYRTESTFFGLFLEKYMELADEQYKLHPFYNQNVRTGRMSCSNPNSQQLNKRAKAIIIPGDEAFLSADASQVEFRIIVHYIDDRPTIEAYQSDPRTDFHQWVADMAQCGRKEGKTLNFAVAFGQGKKTCIAQLSVSPGIVALATEQLGEDAPKDILVRRCRELAAQVYDRYHGRFPGIKQTSWDAQSACRQRGYVFNLFGRRRHLPYKAAHKAFNAIVQGSASDLVKSRMIALAPRYNDQMRRWGVRIAAQVHDELLFIGPRNVLSDPEFQFWLNEQLEQVPVPLSVPILWDMGYSETSWAIAAGDDVVVNERGVKEGRVSLVAA